MQPGSGHGTGPGDIARIGMDPGLYQYNVEFWHEYSASFCQHCTMLQVLHSSLSYNFQFQSSVKKMNSQYSQFVRILAQLTDAKIVNKMFACIFPVPAIL